jgi:hypothetical protein
MPGSLGIRPNRDFEREILAVCGLELIRTPKLAVFTTV